MEYKNDALPARISADGRVATWNPALTRASRVMLRVKAADGSIVERQSVNSGRARVLEGEQIDSIVPLA
ncbi:MAG TPA: hypothetical protein VFI91_10475 [Longimicrobiaceae bacterium]|nr:hypothetical protein [Longimicrobiaceae bacterium]